MSEAKHYAIVITADSNYNDVVNNLKNGSLLEGIISLPAGEGALYAHYSIDKMIQEELLHDSFKINTANNKTLKSMSSGEQKKALLQYIINKKPAFIIIDNVFDNLDTSAQGYILTTLQQVSSTTLIIQIFSRVKDILPFITTAVIIKNNKVVKQEPINKYVKEKSLTLNEVFKTTIPPPLQICKLPGEPLVQLINVNVSYNDRPIINNINWTICAGEFWQLSGPNGSGKSTMLSLITGDNPKGYGQNIVLFGMQKGTGETVWDIKQHIGYLTPNMTQFFPRLDTVENMVLSGFYDSVGLYTKPGELQIKLAREWLNTIDLFAERNTPFCFLPLGKQLMVLVARAMVKHPPLLILDEPTSGLDDKSIQIFTSLINKIATESKTAILYVSHQKEEGLNPKYLYKLLPGNSGSTGIVTNK